MYDYTEISVNVDDVDVWWLGLISGAVYLFMYFDMFYIQWHHLPKRDLWNKVYMNESVSRLVRLGVRHPSGAGDQFFFLLEIFFRQLRVCYFVAPSLTRGRVCNLLLLLFLGSAVPLSIFYCPNSWDSPNLEGQVPVFISPRNRVGHIYPRALGSLSVASYDSQGYGGSILSCLHTGVRKCRYRYI
jgi:hypothetical protein